MKKLLLFISLLTLSAFYGCANNSQDILVSQTEQLNCGETIAMAERGQSSDNFTVLDVRTLEEYNTGHIENAVNIDFYSANFSKEVSKLNKDNNYLVYCRSGNRSMQAVSTMENLGFSKICNLEGGITKWNADGKPILTSG